jgi:hypothetical protein
MHTRSFLLKAGLIPLLLGAALLVARAGHATGPFVEPEAVALYSYTSEQAGDSYGWASENLGDINGDGANDFIVSAPFFIAEGTRVGKIYIYSGADGALLNAVTGNPYDQLGFGVAGAGDVNADGVPDYVAGGRGSLLAPTPFKGRVVVFSGADHSVLHEFIGEEGDAFGYDVNAAGDVNGDGFGDVIVGAAQADFSGFQTGRVYVFSGADGTVLWTEDGSTRNGFLGSAVGYVGDLNGDGATELVAGAFGAVTPNHPTRGRAYVYDGATGTILFTLAPTSGAPQARFGQFFTSNAGDVNGDRVPDIFVADYNSSVEAKYAGKAYVFSGVDGSLLLMIAGEEGDGLGPGRGIGDINGDRHDDLIVAAYTNSDGAPAAGQTYLISGADGTVLRTITGNIPFDFQGVDAVGLGDVSGDGLII